MKIAMTSFVESNANYEKWIQSQIPTVPEDFRTKREQMTESSFCFFRGTFFRWCEHWIRTSGVANQGNKSRQNSFSIPVVLSVGDLHVENFGTWRDQEGRLVWGINDFDEAHPLPYLFDIVRLASSVAIAKKENQLSLKLRPALEAILAGYLEGLEVGGRPFVLEENHDWLRDIALRRLKRAAGLGSLGRQRVVVEWRIPFFKSVVLG